MMKNRFTTTSMQTIFKQNGPQNSLYIYKLQFTLTLRT